MYLLINSSKFYTVLFIIYQLEDYWSIMKLSYRPFTFNLYKAFLKNKNRSGKTLCFIFYKLLKNIFMLYSITWPLTSNFHHRLKKIILPTKFHFNPHWGNFYNMLFFSFEWSKSLLRFPPPHKNSPPFKISHLPNGQISHGFSQVLRTWGAWINTCGEGGELKCCWEISVKEFIC